MAIRGGIEIVWNPLPTVVANAYFAGAAKCSQLREPMQQAVEILADEISQNFAAEGRPDPWRELAEATVLKRGSANPILQDSQALVDAVTDPASWEVSAAGQNAVADLMAPDYGRFHLTGTAFMDARVWDYISPDAEERIDEVFLDWIYEPVTW